MLKVIMLVGGSRSGKSAFAEQMAMNLAAQNKQPVYYIATANICDEEFAMRVKKHRERRPSSWQTVEEPCDLDKVLTEYRNQRAIFLIDGIGTWVTNLMYCHNFSEFTWGIDQEIKFMQKINLFIESWEVLDGTIIMVADEVGMDVVPENIQARIFRDLNGWANQRLAQEAAELHLLVCGIGLQIK